MRFTLKKSIAAGKTFADFEAGSPDEAFKEHIPPFLVSIAPLGALIVIILAGSLLKVESTILIGLAAAILISAVVFRKYLPSQLSVVNEGVGGSVVPILLTSSSVAFGVVITLAPGFKYISSLILGIPGPPLIGLSVASAAFGGITGSSSGALAIVLQAFGNNYLAMGLNPEVFHRVSAIASSVITVMPHSGVVLTMFSLTGLNHKNAFMEQFVGMTGANLLALIAVIVAALMIS